ncbi:MAG TPA: hypothetical protein VFV75_01435 [Candidatus Polarisedimenticolaceae bacterium]|nr:hypothetical protein [Candidatus Polarisedimenticolaceae bacterium]
MTPRRPLEAAAVAAVVLAVLCLGIFTCLGPEERIVFLLYDDAYYYLGVARHLAAGAGSTFDGLHGTNGYHPLWCWTLVPLLRAVSDPGTAVRLAGLLWFALAAAVPAALWWVLRPRSGPAGAALAAALAGLLPWLPPGLARPSGLETPLYALMICLFAGAWERTIAGAGKARAFLLGLLLGGTILARFDGGMLALAAAGLLLARRQVGQLVALALGAALVAGPSLAWNVSRFGSPLPVSGQVVSLEAAHERAGLGGALSLRNVRHRTVVSLRDVPAALAAAALEGTPLEAPLRRHRAAAALAALLLAGATALAALRRRFRRGEPGTDALVLLLLFALLHGAAYGAWLWTSGEARYRLYYFLPQTLVVAACAGASFGPSLWRRVPWRPLRAALTFLLVGGLTLHVVHQARARWRQAGDDPRPVAGRYIYGWAARTLPHDAVLGARDAGRLGWFAPQRVVNLDGLINDAEFVAVLREGGEADYLARSPIRYVLVDRPWLLGFDPAHPDLPPRERGGLPEALWQLHRRPDVDVREVPGATEDWVVTELVRRPPRER